MGRHSRPVLKYDSDGNLVETFESVNKCAKAEGVSASRLRVSMHSKSKRFGFTYKLGTLDGQPPPDKVEPEKAKSGEEPWERNGFFSISGWSKVCI
jgi:hypothetical protein